MDTQGACWDLTRHISQVDNAIFILQDVWRLSQKVVTFPDVTDCYPLHHKIRQLTIGVKFQT
jgi:hypothetical protein